MNLRTLLAREPAIEREGVLDYIEDDADYCENFGDQWNRFRPLQIDSLSGATESRDRFAAETGWGSAELGGKVVLDAGCGAGRFAEIALEAGAYVVAIDMSEAAYACRQTLRRFPENRYLVVRCDMFDLPFARASFDFIYSLGVLQHTPDPLGAISRLAQYLAPGGLLAVWIYEKRRSHFRALLPRLWIRSLTSSWSTSTKLKMAQVLTATFFPIGWALSWLGRPGEIASYFLPYACRHHLGRNSWRRQWDYCVMDTFDWYGPRYEFAQSEGDVLSAFGRAGLRDLRRMPARGLAVLGQMP